MSEFLGPRSYRYVFDAERPTRTIAKRSVDKRIGNLAAVSDGEGSLEAYLALCDSTTSHAIRSISRAFEHYRSLDGGRLPVAQIGQTLDGLRASVSDAHPTQRLLGSHTLSDEIQGMIICTAEMPISNALRPLVSGLQGQLPDEVMAPSTESDFMISISQIDYEPVATDPTKYMVSRTSPGVLAIGESAIRPLLERNGFVAVWERYASAG